MTWLVLALLLFAFPAHAGQIHMTWEHDGADYYTVECHTTSLITFVQYAVSSKKQATFWADARRHYWCRVTATRDGLTSGPSEILFIPRGY